MNLSPDWVKIFADEGIQSSHWLSIGRPDATDREIIKYAQEFGYIIFTHDLDFGAILAATNTNSPSVIQVRTQDVLPKAMANTVLKILSEFRSELEDGALITIDSLRLRVRILPINR